jgi:hypothetical protein
MLAHHEGALLARSVPYGHHGSVAGGEPLVARPVERLHGEGH